MIDTHCHLNFSKFKKNLSDIISEAHSVGVSDIIVPGTDLKHSRKAVEIVKQYPHLYAAVGIHPHEATKIDLAGTLHELETLLKEKKVVAVGEIGMDYHSSEEYTITDEAKEAQKALFQEQVKLALMYHKTIIIHNRESKQDLLPILHTLWSSSLNNRAVFHCCEPDLELLEFAKDHNMFIGVDGDITYYEEKKQFIKQVPSQMLVLETDAPFLLPEPFRGRKEYPNKPYHIPFIAKVVADLRGESVEKLDAYTTDNARKLFNLPEE